MAAVGVGKVLWTFKFPRNSVRLYAIFLEKEVFPTVKQFAAAVKVLPCLILVHGAEA